MEIERDVTNWMASDEEQYMSFANARVALNCSHLLGNICKMQMWNNINLSNSIASNDMDACSLDIDMETGMGKIYAYSNEKTSHTYRHAWKNVSV